jgi:hypothetical protein
MSSQIYEAPRVHVTFDYNLFKLHNSNRPPNHWPKIAKSLKKKDMSRYVPIIVIVADNGYIIIDGQGRYFACMELGLPIYYIISESVGIEDIATFNTGQENWKPLDYLNFYATQGKPDYIRVKKFLSDFTNMRIQYLLTLWQGGKDRSSTGSEIFKQGLYPFPEEARKKAALVSQMLTAIENNVPREEVKNKYSLASALGSLSLNPEFKPNRLIQQIKKYPYVFRAQADQSHYKQILEKVYNYRKRGDNGNIRF